MSNEFSKSERHSKSSTVKSTNHGVDPKFFFRGGMSREEATSAFLATLIEQSSDFRLRFFKHCGIPSFEISTVDVEVDNKDVVIKGDGVVVLIENKIRFAAKEHGQLLRYYNDFKPKLDKETKLHSVYLSPRKSLGQSEVKKIPNVEGETKASITWEDLSSLLVGLADIDVTFAREGFRHVLNTIEKKNSGTEYAGIQKITQNMLVEAHRLFANNHPSRKIEIHGLSLWCYGILTSYVEAKGTEAVGNEDNFKQTVEFRFNLSGNKGTKIERQNVKKWISKGRSVGEWQGFKPMSGENKWFVKSETFKGNIGQIAALLAERYMQLLDEIDTDIKDTNSGTADSKLNQLIRIWKHLSESNRDQLLKLATTLDK
ncbi:PD-(D/E)XK nuclease family protein [Mariniblastus sp.]|nr:PD-(D/E)XK nuclease family protein [Mariniblastus sp.]